MARVVAGMVAVALATVGIGAPAAPAATPQPAGQADLAKGKKGGKGKKGKGGKKGKKGKRKPGRGRVAPLRLFGSCESVIATGDANATRVRGPDYQPSTIAPFPKPAPPGQPVPTASALAPAPQAQKKSGAESTFSGTNVQEQSVDEPDIVKTDGDFIYAIGGRALHVIDAQGAQPLLIGSMRLEGFSHELLLVGDKVLVISQKSEIPESIEPPPVPEPNTGPSAQSGSEPDHPLARPVTVLTEIDVANPSAMKVLSSQEVDGEYLTARLIGNYARVVISTPAAATLAPDSSLRSAIGGWVPYTEYENELNGGEVTQPALDSCGEIGQPGKFSGLDMLSVLTVDVAAGLPAVDAEGVMTDGETVYASETSLYVTTERLLGDRLPDDPSQAATAIHKFDISQPGVTTYKASGYVRGRILNQFSMDEYNGNLRVASTGQPIGAADDGGNESFVSVLREDGDKLALIGRVGNLGLGERIYGVRMIDENAFVVTFRRVDPLYTLDLSKPSNPEVLGELKITGYSAYLHPLDNDRLLGVGAAATKEGLRIGTQVSLFDVSNLKKPELLSSVAARGTRTSVEDTHKAFLYWPPARKAVVPVTGFTGVGRRRVPGFVGALGFDVGAKKITRSGTITHGVIRFDEIERSLVIDDRVYTLSCTSVEVAGMDRLSQLGAVTFPDPDICNPPPPIPFD
jgi:hypothetical protein